MFANARRVSVVAVLVVALADVLDGSAEPSWPMYRGNAQHTRYVPVALDPSQSSLRWQHSVPGSGFVTHDGVSVADRRVFAVWTGSFGDRLLTHLTAIDAATGRPLWDRDLGFTWFSGGPSYADGLVYLTATGGAFASYLYAYNAVTGDQVFQTPVGGAPTPILNNGLVYLPWNGGVSALDASTGRHRWWTPGVPQRGTAEAAAVDAKYAYVYFGSASASGGLFAVEALSGAPAFVIPDPGFIPSFFTSFDFTPVLAAPDNVLVLHEERLVSFDTANRKVRWEIKDRFGGQPAAAHGVVYALNDGSDCHCGHTLDARDQTTGELLWQWRSPNTLIWGAIATNSHVLVSSDTTTYAIDLTSRQLAWSVPIGGSITLADGRLYISDDRSSPNRLVAIDLATALPEPRPDIKVNGVDGPMTARYGEAIAITVSLDPATRPGQAADWWVGASVQGPPGSARTRYWFTARQGWTRSNAPLRAAEAPLMHLQNYSVGTTATLPPGQYDFFFAVDDPDGTLTGRFFDAVTLTIQ